MITASAGSQDGEADCDAKRLELCHYMKDESIVKYDDTIAQMHEAHDFSVVAEKADGAAADPASTPAGGSGFRERRRTRQKRHLQRLFAHQLPSPVVDFGPLGKFKLSIVPKTSTSDLYDIGPGMTQKRERDRNAQDEQQLAPRFGPLADKKPANWWDGLNPFAARKTPPPPPVVDELTKSVKHAIEIQKLTPEDFQNFIKMATDIIRKDNEVNQVDTNNYGPQSNPVV